MSSDNEVFHTYVRASGHWVDFDRASVLMDKELLQQAVDAMRNERDNRPSPDASDDAQRVWRDYCRRHREKYSRFFRPDVIPFWEQEPPPEPLPETYTEENIRVLTRLRVVVDEPTRRRRRRDKNAPVTLRLVPQQAS